MGTEVSRSSTDRPGTDAIMFRPQAPGPAALAEAAVRIAPFLISLTVLIALPFPGGVLAAQEPAAGTSASGIVLTPAEQREVDRLLLLTPLQQRSQARELIRKNPDTDLARTLQRLLDEYAVYDRIGESERAAREAQTAWGRAYWRSCCPPLPRWDPPVGRLSNATGEPVLYEVRLTGIHTSNWMGPYRFRPGGSYASPTPYLVRYLTAAGVSELAVSPGESLAFQGSPSAGTLFLGPAPAESLTAPPAPAPVPTPEDDSSDTAPEPALEDPAAGAESESTPALDAPAFDAP